MLKKAYETKEVAAIKPALDTINEAWKNASEEMYKAQAETGGDANANSSSSSAGSDNSGSDNVEDVDFEEVK